MLTGIGAVKVQVPQDAGSSGRKAVLSRRASAAAPQRRRSGLLAAGASKASANRNTSALKAALNQAVKARLVSLEKAREWHDLKRLKDAGIRRNLYLDRNQ